MFQLSGFYCNLETQGTQQLLVTCVLTLLEIRVKHIRPVRATLYVEVYAQLWAVALGHKERL